MESQGNNKFIDMLLPDYNSQFLKSMNWIKSTGDAEKGIYGYDYELEGCDYSSDLVAATVPAPSLEF